MKKNKKYTILGVMSGTSLDGIDIILTTFHKNKKWEFQIHKTQTYLYCKDWQKKLRTLHLQDKLSIQKTDILYGALIAEKINEFIQNVNIKIDAISSHGHTIFHQPKDNFTKQIGNGNTIADITRIKTINNFRELDVSLNGEGAPLVPVGDLHLFTNYKYCLNLGGFANISIKNNKEIIAFDICPVNIVLNMLANKIGKEYDNNGDIAKGGDLIYPLLNTLNNISFYTKKAPKSLSREWVEKNIYPIINNNYKIEDIMHTFCEHIGFQISKNLNKKEVLITGGGCFNKHLINRIKYYSSSKIIIPSKEIIEFKEALIFAFLGVLRLRNEINCLKSVTGANKDNCGGFIHEI